ncbi:S-layer homology domain-containing protein [Saccharibacillus endophyticus]|uniref:SLH domain-containing protein n=1 Tax=Saccharibacillus endophyticus TaxID=2060666 RepID=A0ABQ1ZTK8_9BACL|nr:S-layer homology domain-containing protein [Saccharibacillus endophyticus]GGH78340.1 hypothetical protein GCM10007362_23490 [Saccharibacillus endophyticus]
MIATKKVLASLLVAASMMGSFAAQAESVPAFKDLNQASSWARDSITQAQLLNLFSGDANGNFRPNGQITREEMAKVIVELLKLPLDSEAATTFKDVPENQWSVPYIEAVKKAGIMLGGGNGTFSPKQTLTREQLAIVIVKALNLPIESDASALSQFQDADSIHDWASRYVASAVKSGLMNGSGGKFNPTAVSNRQEAAMVAVRTYKVKEQAAVPAPIPSPVPPMPIPAPQPIPAPAPIPVAPPAPTPIQTTPSPTPSPANQAPSVSKVQIIGSAMAGETLTGSYEYYDADGDAEKNTTMNWHLVNEDGSYIPIPQATGNTYTITSEDIGKKLVFAVIPRDARGTSGIATYSKPTAIVLRGADHKPEAVDVTVIGTPEVGKQLSGSYFFKDIDGDTEEGSTYEWYRLAENHSPELIEGANAPVYTLTNRDIDYTIVFIVTPKDSSGKIGNAGMSAPTAPVKAVNQAPTVSEVKIIGTPEVGKELTGSYVFSDADGDSEAGTTYAWSRTGDDETTQPIVGANGISYTPTSDDIGKILIFRVTPKDSKGQTGIQQMGLSSVVKAANQAPTASNVKIESNSGFFEIGETLGGSYDFSDPDGNTEGESTYQWYRLESDNSMVPIDGATSKTYKLTSSDANHRVYFEVITKDQYGLAGTPKLSKVSPPILN